MKVINRKQINAFGGINFIYQHLDKLKFEDILESNLPKLATQTKYNWKDIFYSFLSIYYCGGDCIEDINTNLKSHIGENPFCKLPSADRVLDRFKELANPTFTCRTKRGIVDHQVNRNDSLTKLNIEILKKLDVFNSEELTIDYDNTIIFNEKNDSKRTYKRGKGYQPGVATINIDNVLFVENRNGNSDAKSFQDETLKNMFEHLKANNIKPIDNFRADAASYQLDIIKTVSKYCKNFYIGGRNSYIEKYFKDIETWIKTTDYKGNEVFVGEINYIPFVADKHNQSYRLVVRKRKSETKQGNLFTEDDYEYRAIITNNKDKTTLEVFEFYNQRGSMEKQFDILKNDFGWNHMPFSNLANNQVFLYFTAMCRNLYKHIIDSFSTKYSGVASSFRMKKFIFRFIILPSNWIRAGRQKVLAIYGKLSYKT